MGSGRGRDSVAAAGVGSPTGLVGLAQNGRGGRRSGGALTAWRRGRASCQYRR